METKIKQAISELYFDLNDKQRESVQVAYDSFKSDLEMIKSFKLPTSFKSTEEVLGTLRKDEVVATDATQEELFQNCVKFNDSYVVLKNEK